MMSNLQEFYGLRGKDLVAKIREAYSGRSRLNGKASQILWNLMSDNGCVLEPAEDDAERRQRVAAIISGNFEPEYVNSSAYESADPGAPLIWDASQRSAPHNPATLVVNTQPANVEAVAPHRDSPAHQEDHGGTRSSPAPSHPADRSSNPSPLIVDIEGLKGALAQTTATLQLVSERLAQQPSEAALPSPSQFAMSAPTLGQGRSMPSLNHIGDHIKLIMKLIDPSERFNGRESRNVAEDLGVYEDLCKSCCIPEQHMGQILYFVLRDGARTFYKSQSREVQRNFSAIKQALIERYLSPQKLDRIKAQYNTLNLKSCANLEKYGEELLRLFRMLPSGYATEESLRDRLIDGVGQEEVTKQYRTVRPSSYAGAMELIRVWARESPSRRPTFRAMIVGEEANSAASPPTNQQGNGPNRVIYRFRRCGLCGQDGHYSRQCPHLTEDQRRRFDSINRQRYRSSASGAPIPPPSGA